MNTTSKKVDLKSITAEQAQDALNEIALRGESKLGITEQQAFEILENIPDEAMTEATGDYFDFSRPGTYNFKATRIFEQQMKDKKTNEQKNVKVVELFDKSNKRYIAGAAILVNAVEKLQILPAFIRVISNGKAQGKDYFDLSVKTLGTPAKSDLPF